ELPELARQIDEQLKSKPQRTGSALRKALDQGTSDSQFPMDSETNLCLLRVCEQDRKCPRPLLSPELDALLAQLLHERKHVDTLAAVGLDPSKSAILVGPPGVGKTLTAQWVAEQLDMPFYILDLSAVMSSLLGKSGGNIRAAFDFAKKSPCVLLLDEIDSIAKKRSDDSDIGELKRLVTVILQEIDSWPSSSLLIAATNHRELIDPALWRRFDVIAEFKTPTDDAISTAVQRFLGPDLHRFGKWKDILSVAMRGNSFSDVEREILKL
ncbi:AAA family ATPase, partial [Asaia sp. SF2.1]|uniref:AAA family ATPase n=1 Tax=Asaia sp. SF2.1 TaxID=406101 RepID=UPI001267CB32